MSTNSNINISLPLAVKGGPNPYETMKSSLNMLGQISSTEVADQKTLAILVSRFAVAKAECFASLEHPRQKSALQKVTVKNIENLSRKFTVKAGALHAKISTFLPLESVAKTLETLLPQIEAKATTQGIYRASGDAAEVKSCVERLQINPSDDATMPLSAHTRADLVKALLRELNPKLLQSEYETLKAAANTSNEEEKQALLQAALNKLPLASYHLLQTIRDHLAVIQNSEDANLMSYTNLSVCFTPCLIDIPVPQNPDMAMLKQFQKETEAFIGLFSCLLAHPDLKKQ